MLRGGQIGATRDRKFNIGTFLQQGFKLTNVLKWETCLNRTIDVATYKSKHVKSPFQTKYLLRRF